MNAITLPKFLTSLYFSFYPNGVSTVLFFSVGPILTSKAPWMDGDRTAGCRYMDCPDKTRPGQFAAKGRILWQFNATKALQAPKSNIGN